jgi:hypothetical protein
MIGSHATGSLRELPAELPERWIRFKLTAKADDVDSELLRPVFQLI